MTATGALEGIRVLDLTRYLPGPYCTMLLGDLGADVIKVEEPPLGDLMRAMSPAVGGESAAHACLNRNKRSIAIDLRRPEGVEIVQRLASQSDVFVEAFRPGVLSRRGLGADPLCAANPRLVYCSLTGYGQDGPLATRAGHDVNYQALAGFLGGNRDAGGRPVLPPAPVGDMAAALAASLGILAALQARERTGVGQTVDASMFQALLALTAFTGTRRLAGDASPELTGSYADYNVYRCRDGRYLSVGALEPRFWAVLCEALGHPELVSRQQSAEAQPEACRTLAAVFATRDRDEWLRDLASLDVCIEPVLEPEEALQSVHAAGFRLDQPCGDATLQTLAPPLRLGGTPVTLRLKAPKLGEHSDEVLRAAGYPADRITSLRQAGVVA